MPTPHTPPRLPAYGTELAPMSELMAWRSEVIRSGLQVGSRKPRGKAPAVVIDDDGEDELDVAQELDEDELDVAQELDDDDAEMAV